jgi:hypothetical protein
MAIEVNDGVPGAGDKADPKAVVNAEKALQALTRVLADPTVKETITLMMEVTGSDDLYRDEEEIGLLFKLLGRFLVQSKNREKAKKIIERMIAVVMAADPAQLQKLYDEVGEVPSLKGG